MQHTIRRNLLDQHFDWILTVVALVIPVVTIFSMMP